MDGIISRIYLKNLGEGRSRYEYRYNKIGHETIIAEYMGFIILFSLLWCMFKIFPNIKF